MDVPIERTKSVLVPADREAFLELVGRILPEATAQGFAAIVLDRVIAAAEGLLALGDPEICACGHQRCNHIDDGEVRRGCIYCCCGLFVGPAQLARAVAERNLRATVDWANRAIPPERRR